MKNIIIILGEDIDEEIMPAMYRWAKTNPQSLKATLLATSKAQNEPVGSTLAIMESEYQTDES